MMIKRLLRPQLRAPARRAVGLLGILSIAFGVLLGLSGPAANAGQPISGAVFTTDSTCGGTDLNIYTDKGDVYLNGGPAHEGAAGLPDGQYYVQVTEPDGTLLGTSIGTSNPTPVVVTDGEFAQCYQLADILIQASDQSPGYDDTTNPGGEYKVWVSAVNDFEQSQTKTDNFKVVSNEEPLTPLEPQYTEDHQCGLDTVEIPDQGGVIYKNADTEAVLSGTIELDPGEVLNVVAVADDGYELAEGDWTWHFEGSALAERCEETVTPQAPTYQENTTCYGLDTVTVATTEGVKYHALNQTTDLSGQTINLNPGQQLTIVADAVGQTVLTDPPSQMNGTWHWAFTGSALGSCGEIVIPNIPTTTTTVPPSTTTTTIAPEVLPFTEELPTAPPATPAPAVSPQLAFTGNNSDSVSLLALALISMGGFLVIASTWRRRETD